MGPLAQARKRAAEVVLRLSDFDQVQNMELISTLYVCAPDGDSLLKRRWVAERIEWPLGVVNRVLWSLGVRWPHVPPR